MTQTDSQRAMADVERVAEAIWDVRRGDERGPRWSDPFPTIVREQYRAMAVAAITALGLREEYAIVDRSNAGNIAEGHDDADDAIEAMDMYSLDGWMAGSRLVTDWRDLESATPTA